MNKGFKSIYIQMFDENSVSDYEAFLNENSIPCVFEFLYKQKLEHNKKVYILCGEYDKKVLFWTKNVRALIGYCIVEDVKSKPESMQDWLDKLYDIPLNVLEEYPLVISDFVVSAEYRRMGYGKYLAEYIVYNVYSDKKISLHAVDDGVFFWDKIGFEFVQGANSVMVLNGDERYA